MAYASPAKVASVENLDDGSKRVVLRFNGNAGEPEVSKQFLIGESTTPDDLRYFVFRTIRELNGKRTFAIAEGDDVFHKVPPVPAPVGPSQKSVWLDKLARLQACQGLALTGAVAVGVNALLADVNATYQIGFLD